MTGSPNPSPSPSLSPSLGQAHAAQRQPSQPGELLRADVRIVRGTFDLQASLAIHPGEVLAILGPNGSGKSTLLYALSGLVPLSDGRISVGSEVWDDVGGARFVPPPDRSVGLVFQDYRLFPHLSVLDNIAFSAQVRGTRRRTARRQALPWLERVGLAELADRRPAQLSGGQAQRVALARALAADPAMLLLDEPLAALDASTRLEVRSDIRHHLRAFPGCTIMVTHDPLDALVLADRILVLEHGRVTQQGRPADVARHPTTKYVATLMGLNLYTGTLADQGTCRIDLDGGGTLHTTGLTTPDEDGSDAPVTVPPGGRVLAAVSPTAIAIHLTEPDGASPRNVWSGTITNMELLTDRIRVAVDGRPPALVDITPAAMTTLGLDTGQRIWLTAKATEVRAYPDPGHTTPAL